MMFNLLVISSLFVCLLTFVLLLVAPYRVMLVPQEPRERPVSRERL